MTNTERAKDLLDAIEMIKVLELPRDFAAKLNPFVQDKYRQLWADAHPAAKRYIALWRIAGLAAGAKSLEDLIAALPSAADTLRAMLVDGVTLDANRPAADGRVYLVTSDPVVAKKYDMHDEAEFT